MDNVALFTDFQKHVDSMTDDDILKSISRAVNDTMLEESIEPTSTIEATSVKQEGMKILE